MGGSYTGRPSVIFSLLPEALPRLVGMLAFESPKCSRWADVPPLRHSGVVGMEEFEGEGSMAAKKCCDEKAELLEEMVSMAKNVDVRLQSLAISDSNGDPH